MFSSIIRLVLLEEREMAIEVSNESFFPYVRAAKVFMDPYWSSVFPTKYDMGGCLQKKSEFPILRQACCTAMVV